MLLIGFGLTAQADDLEIHVKVPGVEPVWATLRDVQPGSVHRIAFPGEGRTVYHLEAKLEEPSQDYDWQIAFELGSKTERRSGRSYRAAVVAQPTMQAHTNELAQFLAGSTAPVLGSDPAVYTFHGYSIEWIVRPSGD